MSARADSFERNLLGAVLLDASRWEQVSTLSSDDFSLDSHRRMFAALSALAARGVPLGLLTLADELDKAKQLAAVGGHPVLSDFMTPIPTAKHRRLRR